MPNRNLLFFRMRLNWLMLTSLAEFLKPLPAESSCCACAYNAAGRDSAGFKRGSETLMKHLWTKQGLCARHVWKARLLLMLWAHFERTAGISVLGYSFFPPWLFRTGFWVFLLVFSHLPEPASAAFPWMGTSDLVGAAASNGDFWQWLCSGYSSEITVHKALHAFLGACIRLCFAAWLWSSHKLYIFSRLRGRSVSLQKLSAPCSVGQSYYSSSATRVRLKSVKLPPYLQE